LKVVNLVVRRVQILVVDQDWGFLALGANHGFPALDIDRSRYEPRVCVAVTVMAHAPMKGDCSAFLITEPTFALPYLARLN